MFVEFQSLIPTARVEELKGTSVEGGGGAAREGPLQLLRAVHSMIICTHHDALGCASSELMCTAHNDQC